MSDNNSLFDEKKKKSKDEDCANFQERASIPYELLIFSGGALFKDNFKCKIDHSGKSHYWLAARTDGAFPVVLDIQSLARNNQISFVENNVESHFFNANLSLDIIHNKNEGQPPPDLQKCVIVKTSGANKPNEQLVAQITSKSNTSVIRNPEVIVFLNLE